MEQGTCKVGIFSLQHSKVKRPSLKNSKYDAFSHFMNILNAKRSLLGVRNVQKLET